MKSFALALLVFSLVACQRAGSDSASSKEAPKPTPTETKAAPAAAAPAATAPATAEAAAPAAHACGGGCMGGGGCAGCAGGGSCGDMAKMAAAPAASDTAVPADAVWTTLKVPSIHCGMCATKIQGALAGVDGVLGVKVDVAAKTVAVATAPGKDARAIAAAPIEAAGYKVEN